MEYFEQDREQAYFNYRRLTNGFEGYRHNYIFHLVVDDVFTCAWKRAIEVYSHANYERFKANWENNKKVVEFLKWCSAIWENPSLHGNKIESVAKQIETRSKELLLQLGCAEEDK